MKKKMKFANTINKFSPAIGILRAVLAFNVILCHFWNPSEEYSAISVIIDTFRRCAAPIFLILSFYLIANHIIEPDIKYYMRRIKRILIPFWVWGVVASVIYVICTQTVPVRSILFQMVTGHGFDINPPLWYLFVMMVLYTLYSLIYWKFGEKGTIAVICIMVLSMFLQYSRINNYLFGDLGYGLKYPLGRIAEMIPYASVGIVYYIVLHKYYNEKKLGFVIAYFLCLIIYVIIPAEDVESGFGYFGVKELLLCMVIFGPFAMLKEYVKPAVNRKIQMVTSYTFGIYCIHFFLGRIIEKLFNIHSSNRLLLCIILYFICYICCAFIRRLPLKYVSDIVE